MNFKGGGWRHLFSGHRDLLEEKCRPVTKYQTRIGCTAADALDRSATSSPLIAYYTRYSCNDNQTITDT